MKKRIFALLGLLAVLAAGCEKREYSIKVLESLAQLETTEYGGERIPESKLEEYKEILTTFEENLEKELADAQEVGLIYKRIAKKYMDIAAAERELQELAGIDYSINSEKDSPLYYKVLALRSLDFKLYRKAFESLEKAISYDSANPLLFYMAGAAAGWTGKAILSPAGATDRDAWYATAEKCYKRAIEIDAYYVDALYGLAVLLDFELSRPGEAILYAEKILVKEPKNVEAMFLAARIYFELGDWGRSIDMYERIPGSTKSDDTKNRARQLAENVKERLYEAK